MFSFRYAPDFPGYFEVLYHPKTVLIYTLEIIENVNTQGFVLLSIKFAFGSILLTCDVIT